MKSLKDTILRPKKRPTLSHFPFLLQSLKSINYANVRYALSKQGLILQKLCVQFGYILES